MSGCISKSPPPCEHLGVDCTLSSWADFPGGHWGSESPHQAKRNALVLASIEARRSTQFTSKGEKSLQPLSLRPLTAHLIRSPSARPGAPKPPYGTPRQPSTLATPLQKLFLHFYQSAGADRPIPSTSLSRFILSSSHFAPENG